MSLIFNSHDKKVNDNRKQADHCNEYSASQSCSELLRSVLDLSSLSECDLRSDSKLENVFRPQIHALWNRGLFAEAEKLEATYLQCALQQWGESDERSMQSLENLCTFLSSQEKYAQSMTLFEKVVQLRESSQGTEHPETLACQASLVGLHTAVGEDEKATRLGNEILEKSRRTLGTDHVATTRTMANLASLHMRNGDLSNSQRMFTELLEIRSRTLDLSDPDLIRTMINLSTVYGELERWKEAASLASEASDRRRSAMGDTHKMTMSLGFQSLELSTRAEFYHDVVRTQEWLIPVLREVLGPENPEYLSFLESYEATLLRMGYHIKRAKIHLQELIKLRKSYGNFHLDTVRQAVRLVMVYADLEYWAEADRLTSELTPREIDLVNKTDMREYLNELARVGEHFARQQQWSRSENVLSPVLSWMADTLGETDLATVYNMKVLAFVHSKLGRTDEVEWLQLRFIEGVKVNHGETSQQYDSAMKELVGLYSADERWDEAEDLAAQRVDLSKRKPDTTETDLLDRLGRLSNIYLRSEQWEKFDPISEEVLELSQRVYGTKDSNTVGHMTNMASSLRAQGKLRQALDMQKQVLRLRTENPQPSSLSQLYSSRINLGKTYYALNDPVEAIKQLTLAANGLTTSLGDHHNESVLALDLLGQALAKQNNAPEDEELHHVQEKAIKLYQARQNQSKGFPDRYFGLRSPTYTIETSQTYCEAHQA